MNPLRSRTLPRTAGRRAVLLLALGLVLPGCWVLSPSLPPVAPPPNMAAGEVVLEVSESLARRLARPFTVQQREEALELLATQDPVLAEHIRARRIVTGMNAQHVVLCFSAHPTRVFHQGPPGSWTLGWEPGRWFVRLDEHGRVVSAGRY